MIRVPAAAPSVCACPRAAPTSDPASTRSAWPSACGTTTLTTSDSPGLVIEVRGEGAHDVPTDEPHLVLATMQHTWRVLGLEPPTGLRLAAVNGVPHGRGLGSSATAIVAGVIAAQALSFGVLESSYAVWPAPGVAVPVDLDLTTHLASELQGHPDNASASVLGGLTVSWMPDGTGLDRGERTVTARIDPHPDVDVVVFVPETQLATRTARAVLPATVPLAAAAAGAGRAALLVHALTADPSHLHAATRDWLHQEARRPSYPATMDLVDLLRSQGHAAVVSGPAPASSSSPRVKPPPRCKQATSHLTGSG